MSNGIKVVKRDGRVESLDLDKMHVMVDLACEGLAGVSASQVEINSGIQFYDGISTSAYSRNSNSICFLILLILIIPTISMLLLRLLLFSVKKSIYGGIHETPELKEHVRRCVEQGVYDSQILTKYSDEEFEKLDTFIDHQRDFSLPMQGLDR